MNKLKNLSLIAAIASILIFSSCKKEDSNTPPSTSGTEFTFAKAGNSVMYSAEFSFAGNVTKDTLERKYDAMIGNNIWRILDTKSDPQDTSYEYVSSAEYAEVDDATGANKATFVKSNAKVNDVYITLNGADTTYRTIVSLSENISVIAGTFECIKLTEYTSDAPTDISTIWISKKYGFVKYFTGDATDYMKLELMSKNF